MCVNRSVLQAEKCSFISRTNVKRLSKRKTKICPRFIVYVVGKDEGEVCPLEARPMRNGEFYELVNGSDNPLTHTANSTPSL